MSVNIKYKGNTISSINTTATKTLKTSGKYCEADIVVENTQDSGTYQSKTVTPTTSNQTVTPDTGYDALSQVNVEAVTSSIDNNIQPENIKKDVSILGVLGTLESGGGVQVDIQSFTPASPTGQLSMAHFSHGLGVVPDIIIMNYTGDKSVAQVTLHTLIYISGTFGGCTFFTNVAGTMGGVGVIPDPTSTTPGITNITDTGFDFRRPATYAYLNTNMPYEIICIKFNK